MDRSTPGSKGWVNTWGKVAREKQGPAFIRKSHTPQVRLDLQIPGSGFHYWPTSQPEIHEHRNKLYVELPSAEALEEGRWRERICHCGRWAESSLRQPLLLCSCPPVSHPGWLGSLDILRLPMLGQVHRLKLYLWGCKQGPEKGLKHGCSQSPCTYCQLKRRLFGGHREAQGGGSKWSLNQMSWWPFQVLVVWAAPPLPTGMHISDTKTLAARCVWTHCVTVS